MRSELMNNRRNMFFQESVKNLGKTRKELLKEETDKALKKRLVSLGKGFEHPMVSSPS
jgi:hypothetical protein